jgi:hypothetical protein
MKILALITILALSSGCTTSKWYIKDYIGVMTEAKPAFVDEVNGCVQFNGFDSTYRYRTAVWVVEEHYVLKEKKRVKQAQWRLCGEKYAK